MNQSIMMKVHNIQTIKTARYYTLGSITPSTGNIWMVLHGYGMNAEAFIGKFSAFADNGDYIIAPEALSRFYIKGFYGQVGASWMTKEDRIHEISDYTAYLHLMYEKEIRPHITCGITVHLLGFSQGAAALCRYISYAPPHFHHLWICAGEVPDDLNWSQFARLLSQSTLHLLIGNHDEFITSGRIIQVIERLQQHGIAFDEHRFEGGHEIDFDYLQQFRSAPQFNQLI
jgi:predicted esterase